MTSLIKSCDFETTRLKVNHLDDYLSNNDYGHKFLKKIPFILSDEVTYSLPSEWQGINTVEQALSWITDRKLDGLVSVIIRLGVVSGNRTKMCMESSSII